MFYQAGVGSVPGQASVAERCYGWDGRRLMWIVNLGQAAAFIRLDFLIGFIRRMDSIYLSVFKSWDFINSQKQAGALQIRDLRQPLCFYFPTSSNELSAFAYITIPCVFMPPNNECILN